MIREMEGTKSTDRLVEHSATVVSDLKELGRLTNDAAKEKLDEARQMAGRAYERSVRTLGEGRSYLESCVREKPIRSIAIATGAGVLLGYLLSRRR